jgi:hypothetical protein
MLGAPTGGVGGGNSNQAPLLGCLASALSQPFGPPQPFPRLFPKPQRYQPAPFQPSPYQQYLWPPRTTEPSNTEYGAAGDGFDPERATTTRSMCASKAFIGINAHSPAWYLLQS